YLKNAKNDSLNRQNDFKLCYNKETFFELSKSVTEKDEHELFVNHLKPILKWCIKSTK
ncbi:42_t:CDS:1, partial [Cetraspora pellucida]